MCTLGNNCIEIFELDAKSVSERKALTRKAILAEKLNILISSLYHVVGDVQVDDYGLSLDRVDLEKI